MRYAMSDKKCVLVVDDDRHIQISLRECLEDAGFEVSVSADAIDAKKKLAGISQETQIDLAIVDIKMPYLDGLTFIKTLKAIQYNIPVIILSGFLDDDTMRRAKNFGVEEFIDKPFDNDDLINRIKKLLK